MHEIKIGKNDSGQRLDKFLSKALPSLPPALLYKSVRIKKIKVNRRRADIKQILNEGDTLQLFLADEFFVSGEQRQKAINLSNIRPLLDIVYEDENILILNKRPGVSVHEDAKGADNTLLLHMQAYLYQKGEYDPSAEQSFAPALCNRIDRNTGGMVIAAKNAEALRILNQKIKDRQIEKKYLCVVHGIPKPSAATKQGFLIKDAVHNTVKIYEKNAPHGAKEIKTKYTTLATRFDAVLQEHLALLEVELLTGRTHQIRAHLGYLGHPLLGDGKYGVNRAEKGMGYKYQALWSYSLRFIFVDKEPHLLSYLSGRHFRVPNEKIYFLQEFPDFAESHT